MYVSTLTKFNLFIPYYFTLNVNTVNLLNGNLPKETFNYFGQLCGSLKANLLMFTYIPISGEVII